MWYFFLNSGSTVTAKVLSMRYRHSQIADGFENP